MRWRRGVGHPWHWNMDIFEPEESIRHRKEEKGHGRGGRQLAQVKPGLLPVEDDEKEGEGDNEEEGHDGRRGGGRTGGKGQIARH